MQTHHRGEVAAELQVGRLTAAQHIAQDFLDRIAAEGKLELRRQHLEAGEGFLEGAVAAQQLQCRAIPLAQIKTRGQRRVGAARLAAAAGLGHQLGFQHWSHRRQQPCRQGDQARRERWSGHRHALTRIQRSP